MFKNILTLCSIGILGFAAVAHADTIETFTETSTTANGVCCFQVQLDQISSTDVEVTATPLSPATYWAESGGPHRGFTFNLDVSGVSVTNLGGPWKQLASPGENDVNLSSTSDAFGTFSDWIDDGFESGTNSHYSGSLVFDVTRAGGISLSDFVVNGGGYYFSADYLGKLADGTVTTGEGGINSAPTTTVTTNVSTTPEPSSLMLLGTGIVGAAGMLRRRINN